MIVRVKKSPWIMKVIHVPTVPQWPVHEDEIA